MAEKISANEAAYRASVVELAAQVDLWQAILVTHTRTPDGYCGARVCGHGGTGTPHLSYPCPTRVAALYARQMHHGDLWMGTR